MLRLLSLSIVTALYYSAVFEAANGQSTVVSSREVSSASGPDESILRKLDEHQRASVSMHEQMEEKLNEVLDYVNRSLQFIQTQVRWRDSLALLDCSDIKANGFETDGVYLVFVEHDHRRNYRSAYCDMAGTGWTVFQRRIDGSEDFYRNWKDYEAGFGNRTGEFWLGNEFLHLLTSKRKYRLRIDLEDFDGKKAYAEYSSFKLSSSDDKYRLTIGNYSVNATSPGQAGDSLARHNQCQFSTKDQDNDNGEKHCAKSRHGAWWYKECADSNLNGLYHHGGKYTSNCSGCDSEGIEWLTWHGRLYSLKKTEMKITPVA